MIYVYVWVQMIHTCMYIYIYMTVFLCIYAYDVLNGTYQYPYLNGAWNDLKMWTSSDLDGGIFSFHLFWAFTHDFPARDVMEISLGIWRGFAGESGDNKRDSRNVCVFTRTRPVIPIHSIYITSMRLKLQADSMKYVAMVTHGMSQLMDYDRCQIWVV